MLDSPSPGFHLDGWRYWLTHTAFTAAIFWLAMLAWLEVKGRTRGRRRRLLLALPFFGVMALIAALVYREL